MFMKRERHEITLCLTYTNWKLFLATILDYKNVIIFCMLFFSHWNVIMKIGDASYYVSTCCVMSSKHVYVTKTRTDCQMLW